MKTVEDFFSQIRGLLIIWQISWGIGGGLEKKNLLNFYEFKNFYFV